jgi:uncharacterized protein (TIGR02246 family)
MSQSSMRKRVQVLILVFAAVGGGGVWLSERAVMATEAPMAIVDDAKTLAALDDEWSKAAATRDAERVASFYADDAVAYPPGEPLSKGREAAKKVWAAYFAEESFKISWKSAHAEVAESGELGFTSGPYEASYNGPDGKPVQEKGKFLCIWRKQADGSWKATHDMWNADSR